MHAFCEFFTNHWFFAIPMMGMSAVGVTLVIWRLLLNMNANTNMNEFLPVFQDKLEKEGIEGALRFCKARQDIIPRRLFVAGLETAKQGTMWSRLAFDPTTWLRQMRFSPALASAILILGFAGGVGTTYKLYTPRPTNTAVQNPANPAAVPSEASIASISSIVQDPGTNQVSIKYKLRTPWHKHGQWILAKGHTEPRLC